MNARPQIRKVLVVDDDPLNLHLLLHTLTRAGFQTASALDGEAALSRIRDESFDALITDIQMPRLDGIQLLQAVRRLSLLLPVILMTAMSGDHIHKAALEWRATALFEKPVDRSNLVLALRLLAHEHPHPDCQFFPAFTPRTLARA